MITCSTLDTEASVEQSMALVNVGCQIVRITAQTKRYASNLEHIVAGIREAGVQLRAHFPYQSDDVNELPDDISFGDA